MDTLKALIVEKKRSIHKNDASTTSTTNPNNNNNGSNSNSKKKRKQYLTVSQRRQLQQQQQQSTDSNNSDDNEESEKKRKKRRKNKHSHHNNSDDTDSNNDDDDGQDLTTLLTTKRYYDTSLLLRHKQKKGEDESDKNNDNYRRVQLEKVGDATKQKIMGDDDDNFSKRQRLSMKNDDDGNVDNTTSSGSVGNNSTKKKKDDNGVVNIPQELRQLTVDEVTTQLRSYGLPIRLFGEKVSNDNNNNNNNNNVDDSSRLIRLHAAIQGREATILGISEKDEFLLDSADRTRNVFLEKDVATMSTSTNAAVAASTSVKSKEQQQLQQQQQQQNKEREQHLTEEERNDKPKRIYRYFKTLIRQWEEDLNTRSESTKHTLAGKNETKTLKQCKDYIRPLFQLCKRRELDESLQNHLFKIVMNCEEGEFVKAHDAYLDVAIGRAAWPIGVTMVGIHARSGRAKIESANVAHVMNSELQRKYLTSVKRLMSYAQRKRGDVDPSKKVVNL
jgi:pre-mRNA-splicing factor 18